ncbi:MAG: DNA translocase FtsK 4TM domain-containing protein [Lachnospiraceae bacterium]|nr:DNA translocase FtsK 4TM domain-containing protein [Lachnospiraceae bacterium]
MASRNNANNSRPPQRRSGAPSGRSSAGGSRQNQGRQNSAPRGRSDREDYDDDGSGRILVSVIVAGAAVFLTLCAFGACGSFGNTVASVLFGAFGFTGYIAPVFIAGMIFWYMFFNESDELLPIRMTGASVLFLVFGIFSDMSGKVSRSMEVYNAGDLYRLCADGKKGGGVIAGSISYALNKNIGTAGSIIICLLVLILSLFAINRQFFANLFKQIILSASDRTGEFINNQKDKREERRLLLEESERLPELPDNSPGNELVPYEDEGEDSYREAPTVTEKMRRQRDSKKKDTFSAVSDGLENWKNNFKKRTEEERLKKEAGRKIKEETDDAREILVARKAPERKTMFDEHHTGEMHEMSYTEYEPEDEQEEYENNDAKGTWYDPAKRPGALSSVSEPDEEIYEEDFEDNEPSFERVKINSDHKIRVTGEHEEYVPEDTSPEIPDMPEAPNFERSVATPDATEEKVSNASVSAPARKAPVKRNAKFSYRAPSLDYLKKSTASKRDAQAEIRDVQNKLIQTLASFGIEAEMGEYSQGPTVTRYEFTVSQGTKLSRVVGLSDEIKMALAATDIRIEAPIPGKSAIGIEVPNSSATAVFLGDLLSSTEYRKSRDPLSFAVGKDIEGKTVVANIAKFPHVLIAGTTGSGKSVCINTLILSILYKCSPEDVQLIMVDPKVVELKVYNKIPHLPFDVVTKPKAASEMLKWSVKEMERRYRAFADRGVRDIEGYNQYVEDVNAGRREPEDVDRHEETESLAPALRKMPRVVIIIDELADLMMVAAKEVEESICRLAQLARAAGMHLIVATQRPSVDVITGLIKANMPSRIAFAVSSGVDSRTILDSVGAEKLLGKGDMLFYPQGKMRPERLQGAFVSDEEVSKVTGYLRSITSDPTFHNPLADADGINDLKKTIIDIEAGNESVVTNSSSSSGSSASSSVFGDELLPEAGRYIIRSGKASIGYLQRVLKIGFNRAARIMDMLADYSVVGPEQGTKPREILMTEEMFEAFLASQEKSE